MLSWNLLLGSGGAASGGEAGSQSMLPTLITFGLIFVVFYFLIIRPQSKRQKETQNMIKGVKKGDKIQTIGGIHGTVQSLKAKTIVLRVANSVDMEFAKTAISNVFSGSEEASSEEEAPAPAKTTTRKSSSAAKKDSGDAPKNSTRTKKQ